jgi:PBP1b-binding outer membrane lipoprotein LpoB
MKVVKRKSSEFSETFLNKPIHHDSMKKLMTIVLILMMSMLLVACSKRIEPKDNITITEELPEEEPAAPIALPEDNLAEENITMITPENLSEPAKNETEEIIPLRLKRQ